MANQVNNVTPPPPPWSADRLGARIETMLQRAATLTLNAVKDLLSGMFAFAGEIFLESLEKAAAPRVAPLIDQVLATDGLPDWFRGYLENLRNPTAQADALGLSGLVSTAGSGAASSLLAPLFRTVNYTVDRSVHSTRPDPALAYALQWRFPDMLDQMKSDLLDTGWRPDYFAYMEEALRPRLGLSDLFSWNWRTKSDGQLVKFETTARGYTNADYEKMKVLARQYPNVGDLVRMAVRETFDPAQAAALSLFSEFPPAFGDEMEKAGIDREWAEKFWGAHWELPSLGYGIEMFHRGIIDREQLESLMRALDFAPVWRDKLIQLSYNLPTRVDVRRAYRAGVVTRDDVKQVHLALGYDARWAEILTKWTESEYEPEERETTKSDVLAALKRGTISESDARSMLVDLEYSQNAIAFYLAQTRYQREQDLADKTVAVIKKRFTSGLITELQAINQMNAAGVPADEVQLNVEQWKLDLAAKAKSPTVAQLSDFYRAGLIDASRLKQQLVADGYSEPDATLIVRNLDAGIAEAASFAAARAAAEAERIAKAARKTAYEQAAAALDVKIAEQRLAVASAQQALNAAMTEEAIRDAEEQIAQFDAEAAAERAESERQKSLKAAAQAALKARISDVERERLESEIDKLDIALAEATRKIAALKTEDEQLALSAFYAASEEQVTAAKERSLQIGVEIAEIKEGQAAHKVQVEELRASLRTKITDAERQELERAIADADAGQRAASARIAEIGSLKEQLQLSITREITSDDRADLLDAVAGARERIGELQLDKARLRAGE
jgi:hypothetical protein